MNSEQKCFRYKEIELDHFTSILEGMNHDYIERRITSHAEYRHAEIASATASAIQGVSVQSNASAALQKRYEMLEGKR